MEFNLELHFVSILDYHLYNGVWIRISDGSKITCRFRFDGKLKCRWHEGGPRNVLDVTKSSIAWDSDPMIKGSYSDGSITWTNGSTWVKQG